VPPGEQFPRCHTRPVATIPGVSGRVDRLSRELAEDGVDAFFVSSAVSLGYLTGMHEAGGERLLIFAVGRDGRTRMIAPALSATQAGRMGIADVRPWRDGENPMVHVDDLGRDWNLRSAVIAVDDDMPASYLLALQEALPAALFRTGQPVLSRLMRIKDQSELDLMRRAGRIADEALPAALAACTQGVTERELASILTAEMLRLGGTPTFAIVAAGANGAEPHHHSDDTPIREGDVVVLDFGCQVEGYNSDITRTIACGHATEEAREVYRLVFTAHQAARAAIRPGVPAEAIDRAAREVIARAGHGERFMHRTGHGIGLRIHEEPYIIEGNASPLEVGNCFSVEPGVYLPGQFGVRIENIVAVTSDGHESLNAEPSPELIVAS